MTMRNQKNHRIAFDMKKQRSVEVVRRVNEWANGGRDANKMTWKVPCATDWMNQPMKQRIHEPVNQWTVNRSINESTKHWNHESLKRHIVQFALQHPSTRSSWNTSAASRVRRVSGLEDPGSRLGEIENGVKVPCARPRKPAFEQIDRSTTSMTESRAFPIFVVAVGWRVRTPLTCFNWLSRCHLDTCLRPVVANSNGFDMGTQVNRCRVPNSCDQHGVASLQARSNCQLAKAVAALLADFKKHCHCWARQASRKWWPSRWALKLLMSMMVNSWLRGSAAFRLMMMWAWSWRHLHGPALVQPCRRSQCLVTMIGPWVCFVGHIARRCESLEAAMMVCLVTMWPIL